MECLVPERSPLSPSEVNATLVALVSEACSLVSSWVGRDLRALAPAGGDAAAKLKYAAEALCVTAADAAADLADPSLAVPTASVGPRTAWWLASGAAMLLLSVASEAAGIAAGVLVLSGRRDAVELALNDALEALGGPGRLRTTPLAWRAAAALAALAPAALILISAVAKRCRVTEPTLAASSVALAVFGRLCAPAAAGLAARALLFSLASFVALRVAI